MRGQESWSRFPKSVVVVLGSLAVICGCWESGGLLGPGGQTVDAPPADILEHLGGIPDVDPGDLVGNDLTPPEDPPPDVLALILDGLLEPPADPLPPDPPPPDPTPPPGDRVPRDRAPAELVPTDPTDPVADDPAAPHIGERIQLEVDIAFSQEFGETVTDECGTHYYFADMVIDEDKVYPEEYWGTYPLYFFGTEVGVTVNVTNPGPRNTVRLRIRTEAYVLLTDGSSGAQLAAPQETDVDVGIGETVSIDASFTAEYDPDAAGMEGGLDRFIVTVLHPQAGVDEASVIMTKEGVFCPPELEGEL